MRVRERQNHNAETIEIPKIRETEETMVMPAIQEDEILPGDNTANYSIQAMTVVYDYLRAGYAAGHAPDFGLYTVWFCKTLQNWKAVVCTSLRDNRMWEVTYNGDKNEVYLDEYEKTMNMVIPWENR